MRHRVLATGATLLAAATLGAGTAAAATTVTSSQGQNVNAVQGPGGSNSVTIGQNAETEATMSGTATKAIVRQRNIAIVHQRGDDNAASIGQSTSADLDQTSTTGDNTSRVSQKNTNRVNQRACGGSSGQRNIVRERTAGATKSFSINGKEYLIVNQINITIVHQVNC